MSVGFSWTRFPRRSIMTTLKPTISISGHDLQVTSPEPFPPGLEKLIVSETSKQSQIRGSWFGFGIVGQLSQASPTPSPSVSDWFGLGTVGQLSQASPKPSPSVSSWLVFGVLGQLSQTSPTPSPSISDCVGFETVGQLSHASPTPSASLS